MANPRTRQGQAELCNECGYYIYENQDVQYSHPVSVDSGRRVKAFHIQHADCTRSQLMGQPTSPFGPVRYGEPTGLQDK